MRKGLMGLGILLVAGPALWAADPKKDGESIQVPYRLSETQHIILRAKINGKGPYNFIMDTGAPALYVSTTLAKKLGVEKDKEDWGVFDKFEVEGGVVIEKAKGKIADPFQLTGMNNLGMAGIELHGVIGYNLLARYRIKLDLTKDKMTWTKLNFDPPEPEPLEKKGAAAPEGFDLMSMLVKLVSSLFKGKGEADILPRGFLGVELEETDNAVAVKSVLPKSAAAEAGLKAGDRITRFQGKKVSTAAEVEKLMAKLAADEFIKVEIIRADKPREYEFKAGKGL